MFANQVSAVPSTPILHNSVVISEVKAEPKQNSGITSGPSFFVSGISNVQAAVIEEVKGQKVSKYIADLLEASQYQVDAQARLGTAYLNGEEGVPRNVAVGISWLQLAAQKQCAPAGKYASAILRLNYPQDQVEAVNLLYITVDRNYALAQAALGWCYLYGVGVVKNLEQAVKLFTLAAEQKYSVAQTLLGRCYLDGIGVGKNEHKAVKLFKLAADQENPKAQRMLAMCYAIGRGVQQCERAAVKMYQVFADQGDAQVQFLLGGCYEFGIGIYRDQDEALRYYTLAAKQEVSAAQEAVARLRNYAMLRR